MAARAAILGDVGESDPASWDAPFGTPDVHAAITALTPDIERLEAALGRARTALQDTSGIKVILQQEVHQLPTGRTSLGFRDGISYPAIEGTGIAGTNPQEAPLKAGEFVLGYPDETGNLPPMPQPDVLSRNGTYVAIRKLHTKVALWRCGVSTCGRRHHLPRTRNCRRPRWLVAGQVERLWPYRQNTTMRP